MARNGTGKTFFAVVSPAGVLRLTVRLCQQKLYKTMSDCAWHRLARCQFSGLQKVTQAAARAPHPRTERKGPGAVQFRENGHGDPGARRGSKGVEDNPRPPLRRQPTCGGGGGNRAGGGARAACRETWSAGGGRRGAVPAGSSARQSFVAQPRPAPPRPLLRRGPGQRLVREARR